MSRKNTETADKINPIPNVNINKHIKAYGNNKWYILSGVPVAIIIAYNGIKVNKKFIPINKHFESGNIYLGIYILLINPKVCYNRTHRQVWCFIKIIKHN